MFFGEFTHSIDSKGRIIIPSKFRENLGDKCILTKGLDGCLFVYPLDEWKNLEQKLKAIPLTKKDARAFVRFFFSGACECEFDSQGRILIPLGLREYAGINKEAVVIGVSTRIEIWAKEKWDEYNNSYVGTFEDIAEELVELGI